MSAAFPAACLLLGLAIRCLSSPTEPDRLALTPPMGWNSFDSFGDSVTEAEVIENASYMEQHLLGFGWDTVVVDFRWYDPLADSGNRLNRVGAKLEADAFGRLLPAPNRFPSAEGGTGFKRLAAMIHAKGMKFGIHIMRGIPKQAVEANTPIANSPYRARDAANPESVCSWCPDMFGVHGNTPAGQAWYDSLFQLYAEWGVDYVKVDDLSFPYQTEEVAAVRRALDRCGRPMVLSFSPGETPIDQAKHVSKHANLWRISADFWDNWPALDRNFDLLARWQGWGGPGRWPDADMIPLGKIGRRCSDAGSHRWTRFTRDEQVTLMSLWAVSPSPLMLGMHLPDNDEWTLSLLTNRHVLAINQDVLGRQAARVVLGDGIEIWSKELSGGDIAVGVFNRGASAAVAMIPLASRGNQITPGIAVDCWNHGEEEVPLDWSVAVPSHGARLFRVKSKDR